MGAYLIRRLLLVVPTLLGIIIINFAVVQFAPGGPVEQMIAELRGQGQSTLGRITGEGGGEVRNANRPPGGGGGETLPQGVEKRRQKQQPEVHIHVPRILLEAQQILHGAADGLLLSQP